MSVSFLKDEGGAMKRVRLFLVLVWRKWYRPVAALWRMAGVC